MADEFTTTQDLLRAWLLGSTTVQSSAATDDVITSEVAGDADSRFTVNADGKIEWGSGAAATDTFLSRSAVGELKVENDLHVKGKVGFYDHAAVAQPTRVGPIVDNSGGTSTSPTVPAVVAADTDTTAASLVSTKNAIASLAKAVADIESRLSGAGSGAGITA